MLKYIKLFMKKLLLIIILLLPINIMAQELKLGVGIECSYPIKDKVYCDAELMQIKDYTYGLLGFSYGNKINVGISTGLGHQWTSEVTDHTFTVAKIKMQYNTGKWAIEPFILSRSYSEHLFNNYYIGLCFKYKIKINNH